MLLLSQWWSSLYNHTFLAIQPLPAAKPVRVAVSIILFTSLLSDISSKKKGVSCVFFFRMKTYWGSMASATSSQRASSSGKHAESCQVSERGRNSIADRFENLFVRVYPKQPYSKNISSADKNLLDVNFWFHCNILVRRKLSPLGGCLFFDAAQLHLQVMVGNSVAAS